VSRLDDEFTQNRKEDPVSVAHELEVPPPRIWTTDDLDALPDDVGRPEIIDGALILSPSPSRSHQSIQGNLYYLLLQQCPDELDVTHNVEVQINKRRSLIPDVLVVTAAASARDPNRYSSDEVLLAVEIVSPTSEAMDRVMKPALYAKAGIPSYWRIERDADGVGVHTYQLDEAGEVYVPSGKFSDIIRVDQPWMIRLHISDIMPLRKGS
jgi:Uma2 family endonuclease